MAVYIVAKESPRSIQSSSHKQQALLPFNRGQNEAMSTRYVISVDGACSGKRAACAAVLATDAKVVAESSRSLPQVDGYVLAAEIAGVALAGELLEHESGPLAVTVETDNPDVPRVIQEGYQPEQFSRIPQALLESAMKFCGSHRVRFKRLPRNSTPGLRRADKLAGLHLWRRRP
jgi:ribonuclease HI